MVSVQTINSNNAIGDSLGTISNNFVQINNAIQGLESRILSYSDLFDSYFNTNFANFVNAANDISTTKAVWEQARTIVSLNSAAWLQPVTFIYPCIINNANYIITRETRDEITDWVNYNFPVISVSGDINYIETQKAYVAVTFKEFLTWPSSADETIYNNIQTVIYAVDDCKWKPKDLIVGSTVAPTPTPTSSITPTVTLTPTVTPTSIPTKTPTPTPTLTPSSTSNNNNANFFTMTVKEYTPDNGNNTGGMAVKFSCGRGGYYFIRVNDMPYYGDNISICYINNLPAGDYTISIYNYKEADIMNTSITGTLHIPLRAGRVMFTAQNKDIYIGESIQSI